MDQELLSLDDVIKLITDYWRFC